MNAQLENGAVRLKEFYGENPKKIDIYVTTTSTARSNMSGVYSAFVIVGNEPVCLVRDYRVHGCGLDRTFELAYNLFTSAYGYNGSVRYQDVLRKHNLN